MRTDSSPLPKLQSAADTLLTPDDAVQRLLALRDASARTRWIAHCLHALPVDRFLTHLKDVSGLHLNSDPQVAQLLAKALIEAAEIAQRPEYCALGTIAMSDVYGVLGHYEESVAAADEAAACYLALGDDVGWARTRKEWLRSSHRLGRGTEAIAEAECARQVLMRHEQWERAANTDYSIAYVCAELGRYDEALARYDRARTVLESLGDSGELAVARLKLNKAILLVQLGDFQQALQLYEEILPIYHRYGQTISALRQEHNVAYVHAAQGQYTRALHHFGAVLEAYERANLNYETVMAGIDMVECYLNLNRNPEALELAEETVDRARRCGAHTEAARAQFYCALAHAQMGNLSEAVATLDEAARSLAATGLTVQSALVTLQRATFHLDDEQWSAALEEATRAGALFAHNGLVVREAQADLVRARASFALGAYADATRLAQAALVTSRAREVPWLAHDGYHVLGRVAQAQGNDAAALVAYSEAVASIERLQSSLAIELRTHFLEDKLRIYEDAIATSLRLAQPETAFQYLERAKSRALVDYLASNLEVRIRASEHANEALLGTLTHLREEHNWFYNRLAGYGLAEREDVGPALSEEALRAAIRDREKKIARILERLTLDRSEGLAVPAAAERSERFAPPSLDPGAVLLEYYLTDKEGAVFVVSADDFAAVPLVVRPREIARLLYQWQLNLAAAARAVASGAPLDGLGRNARGILTTLYQALIAPVATYLTGCERLVVVPYGPMHSVPFHALFNGARYLLEDMEVSVCPSSALLQICRDRPRHVQRSALTVAYTDGGRLPAVLAEAWTVAGLFPGECYVEDAATRDALTSAASRHAILHVAAHGEARLDNPTFAHVKLADSQLSMVDIFNLRLEGALVTLSACETGRSVVAGGDELIGLSRGFLYAGASTLVQSLWRVEDDSTARLMKRFYESIRAGKSKGVALQDAQRAMLDVSGVHPYYWAPFQLIGDRGPL